MATTKQKRALAKAVENGGVISRAMLDAGYSPATAKTPQKLTNSKSWQRLMEKHFPDADLAKLHKRLLKKEEGIVVSDGAKEGSHIEWTGQPHSDTLRALEAAYKLKGRFVDEPSGNKTLIINITGETASRYGILPTKQQGN